MKEKLFSVTIKDCVVQPFRSTGKGGQHRNKVSTAIRVIHEPSGARAETSDSRSQIDNKRSAFLKMAKTEAFQRWARIEAAKCMGQESIEERVDKMMQPRNLLVETYTEQGWVDVKLE